MDYLEIGILTSNVANDIKLLVIRIVNYLNIFINYIEKSIEKGVKNLKKYHWQHCTKSKDLA